MNASIPDFRGADGVSFHGLAGLFHEVSGPADGDDRCRLNELGDRLLVREIAQIPDEARD